LSLGMGDPEYHAKDRFDPALPGCHRVVEVTPALDRDVLLPDSMIGVVRDGQWRCTETLRYAAEQGVRFTVAGSYVWPDSAKPLAMFAERVRTGRTDLTARAEADPAAALALGALKETYAALGGALASRTTGDREPRVHCGVLIGPRRSSRRRGSTSCATSTSGARARSRPTSTSCSSRSTPMIRPRSGCRWVTRLVNMGSRHQRFRWPTWPTR